MSKAGSPPTSSPTPSVSTLYDVPMGSDDSEKMSESSGVSILDLKPCLSPKTEGSGASAPASSSPRPSSTRKYSYSLFDSAITHITWDYTREVLIVGIMLVILMWAALPLYWGSLAPGTTHAPSFKAWVVDFDGGRLGDFVTQSVMKSTQIGTKRHLGWEVRSAAQFGSPAELAHQLVEEKAWVAISINPGASAGLSQARSSGNSEYDPTKAVTLYVVQARNENAYGQLIYPISTELMDNILRQFNTRDMATYIETIQGDHSAIEIVLKSPVALAGAWWEVQNLRPWTSSVATPMTVVGQIYLAVFTFILTMATFQARRKLEVQLGWISVISLRLFLPLLAYLPLSISYAMLSVSFHAPFGTKYNFGGGFFLYVAYVYMDMSALGLACEAAVLILQPRFMTFFLVSWLIINVSTPVEPQEMQSWWYKYGYGMPFYNHATAVRTILFDTKNILGRNAGVLVAWMGLSSLVIVISTWVSRRRELAREAHEPRAVNYEKTELVWSADGV